MEAQGRAGTIRILIADPHPIFRDCVRMLLESEGSCQVVGGAGDPASAVKMTLQLKPDILLFDLAMPFHPAMRELSCLSSQVRVIGLTAANEKDRILEALRLGARGVLLRDSTTQLLFKSIRTVMAGQYWLGRESVSEIVEVFRDLRCPCGGESQRETFGLTPRELEIVGTVVAGYTNKDIAQKFSLSEQTVKHHLTNIFDKLGVYSRLELALFAVNHHLVAEGSG